MSDQQRTAIGARGSSAEHAPLCDECEQAVFELKQRLVTAERDRDEWEENHQRALRAARPEQRCRVCQPHLDPDQKMLGLCYEHAPRPIPSTHPKGGPWQVRRGGEVVSPTFPTWSEAWKFAAWYCRRYVAETDIVRLLPDGSLDRTWGRP